MAEEKALKQASLGTSTRSNVVINLIRTLTLTVLSFITFPYVCRILGDQTLGLYTWANTFVYYFLILAKISIPNIAIRECVKVRDDRKALSHTAQEFFLIQAITTLISFGLLIAIVFSVPELFSNRELLFLLSVNFLAGVFSFEWIYIALEKHFYIAVRSIFAIALSAVLVFVFITPNVQPQTELFVYAAITISSTLVTSLVNCLVLPKYIDFKVEKPFDFRPLMKPLFVLFSISLVLTLYNQTDVVVLGFIDESKSAVGSYSVGVKGIEIVITIITSLSAVFMPRATFYYQKDDKRFFKNLVSYAMNITFFIAVPAIATMIALAGPITSLISGNYASGSYGDAKYLLMILASMMLTYSIGDDIYTEILIPIKKEHLYFYTMLIGVTLNVALSIVLAVFVFSGNPAIGVAVGTGLTDLLILVFLIGVTWEYSHAAIFSLNNLKIILFGLLIAALSGIIAPLIEKALPYQGSEIWISYIYELLIVVAIDALVYVGGLLLCHEKLVSSFMKRKKAAENG